MHLTQMRDELKQQAEDFARRVLETDDLKRKADLWGRAENRLAYVEALTRMIGDKQA